jgi:hypothetical protein
VQIFIQIAFPVSGDAIDLSVAARIFFAATATQSHCLPDTHCPEEPTQFTFRALSKRHLER